MTIFDLLVIALFFTAIGTLVVAADDGAPVDKHTASIPIRRVATAIDRALFFMTVTSS